MLVKTEHNKILFYLETKTDVEISRSRFAKGHILKHS